MHFGSRIRERGNSSYGQEASDFHFPPRRGEDVPWFGFGRRFLRVRTRKLA
jgi:hypothetical protein